LTQKKYKILKQIIDGRTSKKNIFEEEQLMVAAVSILIEKDNPNYPIYMIKRADEGKHALEWAFPGGKMETTDLNLKHTATRETNEEIGADIKDFEIWGELDPVMTVGTGWAIQPFVGEINHDPMLLKNDDEVEEIVKIPLFDLIDDSNKRFVSFIRDDVRVDSKAFAFEDKLIWGASARMIIQISDLIENKVKNG
jgi:8-oxo-dGTP pyrophosphatase MutT (NUDIX family)|tara:strand:- start:7970 stop:8557 length:588 start_codon:yes stop_codon:yes gene_type:complete